MLRSLSGLGKLPKHCELVASPRLLAVQRCFRRPELKTWRDGRVVEGAALEMLFGRKFNEGSNPSLSVSKLQFSQAKPLSLQPGNSFKFSLVNS